MHSLFSILFVVVLVVALNSLPTSSKTVATTKSITTTTTTTTTKAVPTVKTTAAVPAKKPAAASKPKKKPADKRKKPAKKNPWKVPTAAEKKLFNDYKTIIRTKIIARHPNVTATFPLEPIKHGLQVIDKTTLHHFLVKLPDGKYAHAVVGIAKDGKKPVTINENSVSVRRSAYDTLEAAEA